MRYLVPLFSLLLFSCDTYDNSNEEPWLRNDAHEATSWDGGTACWIVEGIVRCYWDMSQPLVSNPDLAEYNPCVVRASSQVMTGSEQAKECLTQHLCIDSNGESYVSSLWDSCHGWQCRWRLACSNNVIYCAPDNTQSGPEYSDDTCMTPIVLAPINKPPLYVGIQKWVDDGGYCYEYYALTTPYKGDDLTYYLSQGTCNAETIDFPGIEFWNVNPTPVDPSSLFTSR
jgi:hypothetical protein